MRIDDRRIILSTETGGSSWKGAVQEVGDASSFKDFSLELPGNPRSLGEDGFYANLGAWLQKVGVSASEVDHAFFAIAGYDTQEDLEVIKRAMKRVGFQSDSPSTEFHNDMMMGIAPFSQEKFPIRIAGIAGTGTNWGASVFGLNRLLVAGGTGPLLSDQEGGGFGIGHKGLQYVANCILDQGLEDDEVQPFERILARCPRLVKRICEELDLRSLDSVIGLTVPDKELGWGPKVKEIARAARIVVEEAACDYRTLAPVDADRDFTGINQAQQIVYEVGNYLSGRFEAVYKSAQARLNDDVPVHLTLLGSVIEDPNGKVRSAFNSALERDNIYLYDPRFTVEAFGNTIPLHRENLARIARSM